MKRKITSLAVLVLSCLMVTPVLADDEQGLTGAGELVTVPEAGKYYLIEGNGQQANPSPRRQIYSMARMA